MAASETVVYPPHFMQHYNILHPSLCNIGIRQFYPCLAKFVEILGTHGFQPSDLGGGAMGSPSKNPAGLRAQEKLAIVGHLDLTIGPILAPSSDEVDGVDACN
jgi:hypothetical protein